MAEGQSGPDVRQIERQSDDYGIARLDSPITPEMYQISRDSGLTRINYDKLPAEYSLGISRVNEPGSSIILH